MSLRISMSALTRREIVFQLLHFIGRSHRALGWNGSGDCRPDWLGHQVSETSPEVESAPCIFRRAQKVGRTLEHETL